MFDIDVNGDNVYNDANDAIVIAFSSDSNYSGRGSWFDIFMSDTTNVHVVLNRPGLAAGTFSASGTQGTLAALRSIPTGYLSQTWGDLNVLNARIGMGLAGGPSGTLEAYVDEAVVTTVPTPGALALLGLGGIVTARRRR
jgi:MYXO-CTERM domain-containing protein